MTMEPLTHRPTPHKEWNESYYFVFYDLKQRLGGMTRLGFKPSKSEGTTFLFLFLPEGSAAGYQSVEQIKDHSEKRLLRVGSMIHEWLPDGKWRYCFEGNMVVVKKPEDLVKVREDPALISKILPVKLSLFFTPINEIYEYSKHMTQESREIGRKAGDAHWEQIAMVSGEIRLGGELFCIKDSMGQRDHTHGIRDWTHIDYWLYYVIWFSKELAINPAAIITNDGRVSTGGFIFKNGKNIPIIEIKVLEDKFRDDVIPVSSKLELRDGLGDIHILEGQAGSVIPVPFFDEERNLSILAQSFGSFKLDGISGGYGSYETLRRRRR